MYVATEVFQSLLLINKISFSLTFFIIDINSNTVWDWTVEGPGLVVVFCCEALLQPVVQMDAPGGAAFPQLVEPAEVPQRNTHSEGLALLVKPDFPILMASVNHRVSCYDTQARIDALPERDDNLI